MKNINRWGRKPNREKESDLERVIEPLAGYICATDRPEAALKMALAVLRSQVEQTNRAAKASIAGLSAGRIALPA